MSKLAMMAVAAAMFSTSVIADAGHQSKATRLSDAQLDQITAGAAISVVAISNPGNAEILKINPAGTHGTCVNCGLVPPTDGGATGLMIVQNNGHPTGKTHTIGRP